MSVDEPSATQERVLRVVVDACAAAAGEDVPVTADLDVRHCASSLLAAAARMRVLPIVDWYLQKLGLSMPEWFTEAANGLRRQHDLRVRELLNEVVCVLARANDLGIPYALRKGAHTCYLYPERGLRRFSDVDLLVSSDGWRELSAEFQRQSFESINGRRRAEGARKSSPEPGSDAAEDTRMLPSASALRTTVQAGVVGACRSIVQTCEWCIAQINPVEAQAAERLVVVSASRGRPSRGGDPAGPAARPRSPPARSAEIASYGKRLTWSTSRRNAAATSRAGLTAGKVSADLGLSRGADCSRSGAAGVSGVGIFDATN